LSHPLENNKFFFTYQFSSKKMSTARQESSTAHGRNRGRALLIEALPEGKFGYTEGVLFMIFINGEAFFYPLTEFSKGDYEVSNNPKAISISTDTKRPFHRGSG
jgi:hypothetical protein